MIKIFRDDDDGIIYKTSLNVFIPRENDLIYICQDFYRVRGLVIDYDSQEIEIKIRHE